MKGCLWPGPMSAGAGTFEYTLATFRHLMALLEVDRLTTAFPIEGRLVNAVSSVSFSLDAGETLALVGESGCGKSLTALSILRLVDPPGRIMDGAVRLQGRDLLTIDERAMRAVRGREIGLVL
jgi:peptide/nickel transport system ATP-binding protein